MKISTHLILAGILWAISGAGGFLFLKYTDPVGTSPAQLSGLYAILFVWIYSGAAVLGYGLRLLVFRQAAGARFSFWRAAQRQGLLLGLLAVAGLVLASYSFLNTWTVVPMLAVFFLIELYAR